MWASLRSGQAFSWLDGLDPNPACQSMCQSMPIGTAVPTGTCGVMQPYMQVNASVNALSIWRLLLTVLLYSLWGRHA